ncbi:putative F-box and FNIP repeat-containing protein [Megavirus lba]|uniref:Putative F-box and FNIP repeat-containing protein n=1 Tax=Megavirus lba TaxID=1235314 RepID=L7XZY4_9VIRU|nr:putative F-box and FNIP repeat-containing protein [Megavirus lba]
MSDFDILNHDVILYIFDYLSDKEKLNLCLVNKNLRQYINNIYFGGTYDYNKIKCLYYYSRFKNITYKTNTRNIPKEITHLTFKKNFNQNIQDSIPNSVKYLTFGKYYNQPIIDISNSVIYLKFGYYFNQKIKNILQIMMNYHYYLLN